MTAVFSGSLAEYSRIPTRVERRSLKLLEKETRLARRVSKCRLDLPTGGVVDVGNSNTVTRVSTLGEATVDDAKQVHVPDAVYSVAFVQYTTGHVFGRPKLCLWFRVVDQGPHFDARLPKYYGLKECGRKGRMRNGGRFIVGRRSNFVADYDRIFRLPSRLDRLSLEPFRSNLLKAQTRTVSQDYQQKALSEPLTYSVIDRLWRVEL